MSASASSIQHDRVASVLAAGGFDAVIATSRESVFYLSGVDFYHHRVAPTELTMVIWPRDGEPRLLAPDWTAAYAAGQARMPVDAWDWRTSSVEALAGALRTLGLGRGILGFEKDHLTAGHWITLGGALPQAELAGADEALAGIRLRKTPLEIDVLARAAQAADQAILAGFRSSRAGMTERDLALAIRHAAYERGADDVAWLFLSSGERNRAGGNPTDRQLGPGELLRVDLGVVFDGYHADLARTAAVAPATPLQRELYELLWTVHEGALAMFEPGRTLGQIFDYVIGETDKQGLQALDSYIGHSVGVGIHEPPTIGAQDGTRLEPRMVFCLEPAVESGDELVHVEDMVLVTDQEPRILSGGTDWSRLPELGA